MRRFLTYHLPATMYAALIIAVSSIPNLKTPRFINLQFDKVAHLLEYAVLAFLIYRSTVHMGDNISRRKALFISAILAAILALFDELYQRTVSGRDSSISDFITDLSGATLVLILLWYRGKSRNSGLL